MFISGCTIIRNAELMGYPVVQAIRSILPIVDEYVVGVGQSDDQTRALIESIDDPKLQIFDSHWDTTRQSGGAVLADKTNEALARCSGDWIFYLQGDEVVHEDTLPAIVRSCTEYRDDPRVEGFLFKYVHFYGSFSVVAIARNWYRQEVRIVRRAAGPRSIVDAQSFRVGDRNRKARVRWSGGTIHHYGHVKPPQRMGQKHKLMTRWYHGNRYDHRFDEFQFRQIYGLQRFEGTHPAVMQDLVAAQDWSFEPRLDLLQWNAKDYKNFISDVVEAVIRHRIDERKQFKLLK